MVARRPAAIARYSAATSQPSDTAIHGLPMAEVIHRRFMRKAPYWIAGVLGAAVLTALFALQAPRADDSSQGSGVSDDTALVERGRYVALAANCASCHTRRGGAPYAGGVPFESPV